MKQYILVGLLLLLIGTRFLLFYIYQPRLQNGQYISFTTTVMNDPQRFSSYNILTAIYSNFWSYEKISLKYSPNISLNYGDRVVISGKIIITQNNKLLKNKNAIVTMSFPKIEAKSEKQNKLLAVTSFICQEVKNFYYENLSSTDAGLLLGIVLGQKANFSKTFQQYLSTTGTMHVIAASGMNVTMLAGFLFGLFGLLFQRRVAIAGSVIGIVYYMILAGLQASILRAGIMAIIAFSGQMLGRQYTALYGLALTCLGLLLWNPILITDIGFQLSVGATLGIIFIKPLLFHKEALEDINTTIAAQLATLPILLTSFGTYGLASILVNTLVLWTIPLITILGGIGAIISFIFPFLGNLLITLSIPLLWWFETVIIFFGKLGWNIQVQSLNWEIVVGYYLSLIGTIYFFDKKKSLE